MYCFERHQNLSLLTWSNFPELVGKEQSIITSTGLINNGLFGLNTLTMSNINHRLYHFESLRQYYFGKNTYVWLSKFIPKTGVTLDEVQQKIYQNVAIS